MDGDAAGGRHAEDEILESLPGGLLVLDEGGAVVMLNRAGEQILGVGRGQLTGRRFSGCPELGALRDAILTTWTGAAVEGQQMVEHSASGRRISLGFTISRLPRSAQRWANGIVVHFADITEKLRFESSLIQTDKLATLGTMASALAHEINNPMTVIIGTLESLVNDLERREPEGAAQLKVIERSALQCVEIVRRFLKFSRPSASQAESAQVPEVLQDLMALLGKDLAARRIAIHTFAESTLPPARMNATRLQQILLNLIVNARDAMPEGGVLTLRASEDAGQVLVEVIDTGTGIEPAVLPHIFDRFFTTKSPGSGTGLGLAICRTLATGHGGSLTAESEVGKGTRFLLRLPVAARAVARAVEKPKMPARIELAVLAVDDEGDVLEMYRAMLSRMGCKAQLYSNPLEALKDFSAGKYDLALLDLRMPEMTGDQLCQKLRAIDPDLPVLFLTGTLLPELQEGRGASMALGYIQKPFQSEELFKWLQRVDRSRRASQPAERAFKVLLVDDDEDQNAIMATMLTDTGRFQVSSVTDGLAGLERAKSWRPDLIVLDVMMPSMNGFEVCQALKADPDLKGVPVVFLSVRDEVADVTQAMSLGASNYLMKPIDPAAFPGQLLEVLAASGQERDRVDPDRS